jgi:hypothetical protein
MGPDEMDRVADLLMRASLEHASKAVLRHVHDLVGSFPTVYYCFEHPYPPAAGHADTRTGGTDQK